MVGTVAFWLALSQLEVVGDGTCPAPADVSRRLAELIPAAAAPGAARVARLSRIGDNLQVVLAGADGQRLGERELPAHESCADLAAAVAVVIAAWEAQIDPRVTARVDLPPPAGPPVPAIVAVQPKAAPPPRGPGFDLGLGAGWSGSSPASARSARSRPAVAAARTGTSWAASTTVTPARRPTWSTPG